MGLLLVFLGFIGGAWWGSASDRDLPIEKERQAVGPPAAEASAAPRVPTPPVGEPESVLVAGANENVDEGTEPETEVATPIDAETHAVPGLSMGGFEIPGYTAPKGVDRRTEDFYRRMIHILPFEIRKAQLMDDPSFPLRNIAYIEAQLSLVREARYAFLGEWEEGQAAMQLPSQRIDVSMWDSDEFIATTNVGGLVMSFHVTRSEFPGAFNPK